MTDQCRAALMVAVEAITEERSHIDGALDGLRRLLDIDAGDGLRARAGKAQATKTPTELVEKWYGSERWADRKIAALKAEGITATKAYCEGDWIVSWPEEIPA